MKYGIFRMLGNELPPRDMPGMKLKILEFILRTEKHWPHTEKWFIVNHILNDDFKNKTVELLEQHQAKYIYLPFDYNAFTSAKNYKEQMVAAIPVNICRNLAVQFGQMRFDYTAVLDGDCYFPRDTWHEIVVKIESGEPSLYYSLPMVRSCIEMEEEGKVSDMLDEPQVIFHSQADFRFDESLPWGNFKDKLDLLLRLGHKDHPGKWHVLEKKDRCRTVGQVHHLASGPYEYELDPDAPHRADMLWMLREHAFHKFMSNLVPIVIPSDVPPPPIPLPYTNTRKKQS